MKMKYTYNYSATLKKFCLVITTVSLLLIGGNLVANDNFGLAKTAVAELDYNAALPFIRAAILEKPNDMEYLRLATRIYLDMELVDTAVLYGKRIYADDDNDQANVFLCTEALIRGNAAVAAVAIMRKYSKKNSDVQSSLYLVKSLIAADSIQEASLVANTAKAKNPKSTETYAALGDIYFNYKPQPVYDLAIMNYEEAVKLQPDDINSHAALAQCYWKQANAESDIELGNELFKRCLLEWNAVTKLDPKNARAWFEQGKIFFLSKKYPDAIQNLTRYRELRPIGTGNPMSSWYLGNSYFKMNQCDSARKHLDDAARQIDTLKGTASVLLARCSFFQKDWKKAATLYKVAENSKKDWEGYDEWYFGAATLLAGDTTQAIEIMRMASFKDPTQCTFMLRFGLLLQSVNRASFSTKIFRARISHCNDSLTARLHAFIGNNFYADSLVDSALTEYMIADGLEPNNTYIQSRLAETYLVKGDQAKSNSLYETIILAGKKGSDEDKRMASSAIMKLNAADIGLKSWSSIIERSKMGLEFDPTNKWLMLYMGIGYQGLQDTPAACRWYKEVLKLDPSNEPAKQNLKAINC
ncbi:MAG: hypothetical protein HQ472_02970 [Ignavibacteria bacterium]|nr:hypothetical protein [Ignavibacteria bacterium]